MQAATQISGTDPSALDYSMLGHSDLVNVVLQRSEILHDVKAARNVIRAWIDGDPAPLDEIVETMGAVLAQRAVRMIHTEFELLRPLLDRLKPARIADIGCGYGFFDLFVHNRYGSDLLLIDIEDNDHRHFGSRMRPPGIPACQLPAIS